jgi:hypothetical protein
MCVSMYMHAGAHVCVHTQHYLVYRETVIWNSDLLDFVQLDSGSVIENSSFIWTQLGRYLSNLSPEVRQAKFPKHLFFQNIRCQTQSRNCSSKPDMPFVRHNPETSSKPDMPFSEPCKGDCNFHVK